MKIKFTCNWCTDKSLYLRILSNYAIKPNYYEILTFGEDYDYLVIINDTNIPIKNKEKTIGLAMEPSWQNWNKDLHNMCKLVLFHDKSLYNWPNVVEWTNCGFIHDIISHEMFFDNLPSNMTNNLLKKKDISFICGITNSGQMGYKMRNDLLNTLQTENVDIDIYGRNIDYNPSKNQFGSLKLKYTSLIDYKFSICIENSFENGYVSEKLYDCFMCNTVPIYCGAPNIFDIFSERNIIKVSNVQEILDVVTKIKYKEIKYEDFNTEDAKRKYLTDLNLITQVLNAIKIYNI